MASLNIEADEEIYEGKLYGWRWFVVVHGAWVVTPPMFSANRTSKNSRSRLVATGDGEEYFELLNRYLNAIDLYDWNQSDIPPSIMRSERDEFSLPSGHASGFHLFSEYRDAVNYAIVPYTTKVEGMPLPWNSRIRIPENMAEHMLPSTQLRIKATPLLAFVEASGAIVEHDKGYRAHLLRIVSLYSDGRKRARQELADNIGWPGVIHKYRKLRNMKNPSDTDLRRLDCD